MNEPKILNLSPYENVPVSLWNFNDDQFDHPIDVSNSLAVTLEKNRGYVIAGNQVGINRSVMFVKGAETAFFNLSITSRGDDIEVLDEFSLSFPMLIVKVPRAKVIRVRYCDVLGEVRTNVYTGMTARAIQQAEQTLAGELFCQGISKLKLDMAIKRAKKRGFDYTTLLYGYKP